MTIDGGTYNNGTVFRITPQGSLTTIYSFSAFTNSYNWNEDGASPGHGLTRTAYGTFFGTTDAGGEKGVGTVFRIDTPTTNPKFAVVHSFTYYEEGGAYPGSALIIGRDGNLYGTTRGDGAAGPGTVFKLTPAGNLTTLHSFTPAAGIGGVVQGIAPDTSLYGTTQFGGAHGYGTVFKLAANGAFQTIHDFTGLEDGEFTTAPLCFGKDGRLYESTRGDGRLVEGSVFRLNTNGTGFSNLLVFDGKNGAYPEASLVHAPSGYFYGTTALGGPDWMPPTFDSTDNSSGTVFRVAAPGTATFLRVDTTTHGNWKGRYGADGHNVIGDTTGDNPHYRDYVSATPTFHYSGIWTLTSSAPQCLQATADGSKNRIAGVWYQRSWSMNVNVDGTHQLAVYLLDYPNVGYAETITIKDAATGTVLDTRPASSFAAGDYYVWNVSGNVTITLTSTAGHWAVLSGIFFG